MKTILIAGVSVVSVLLASCATMTMTPAECSTAKWKEVGYQDAMKGSDAQLEKHEKSCAKSDSKPDKVLYMWGYNAAKKEMAKKKK